MIFFIAEVIYPINCTLTSEEVSSIKIVLNERRSNLLKGSFYYNKEFEGFITTSKPTDELPPRWSFSYKENSFEGEIILFHKNKLWHRYQKKIKSYEVDRAIFSGLSSNLKKYTNDLNFLKAASGFFRIGDECYGGRIKKT